MDAEDQTYEEWESMMLRDWSPHSHGSWRSIGNWLYPGISNDAYHRKDMTYHVCRGNYERLKGRRVASGSCIAGIEEGCLLCGAEVPDGIKMIMLLGKL